MLLLKLRSEMPNLVKKFQPVLKIFFFYLFFFFFQKYPQFTGHQEKEETISLYSFKHFRLFHRHLDISWVIAAENSPLHIAGSRNCTWNLWYTLFGIHLSTLALVAVDVKRMLKTRVTMGNIYRVLLNVTKRLIFAMFKDSPSLPMLKTPRPSQCSRS